MNKRSLSVNNNFVKGSTAMNANNKVKAKSMLNGIMITVLCFKLALKKQNYWVTTS